MLKLNNVVGRAGSSQQGLGEQFQKYLQVKSHNGFAIVKERWSILHNTTVTMQWAKNGLISRMLFSELHKIMVNKAIFIVFRGAIAPSWIRPCQQATRCQSEGSSEHINRRPRELTNDAREEGEKWQKTKSRWTEPALKGLEPEKSANDDEMSLISLHEVKTAYFVLQNLHSNKSTVIRLSNWFSLYSKSRLIRIFANIGEHGWYE